ncbi:MAG: permease [Dehalococcoidales bacterium]
MKRSAIITILLIAGYFIFLLVSWFTGFSPGQQIGQNFVTFSVDMLKILPGAFILIGLFEVWVKRETVERHLGEGSGFRGYLWVILLAGTTVGGLYLAFPVAYTLYRKGAKLSVVFTYLGAAAICRIPMAIFEASFLGVKFTVIRWLVSLPLVVITSILLGNYLTRRGYRVSAGK